MKDVVEGAVEQAEDVEGHALRGAEAGSAEERWTLVEQSPVAFAASALARPALLRTLLKTPSKTLLRTLLKTLLKMLLKRLLEKLLREAVERGC